MPEDPAFYVTQALAERERLRLLRTRTPSGWNRQRSTREHHEPNRRHGYS